MESVPAASPRRPLGYAITNSRPSTYSSTSFLPRHAAVTLGIGHERDEDVHDADSPSSTAPGQGTRAHDRARDRGRDDVSDTQPCGSVLPALRRMVLTEDRW
jgi:hypothetical protein